MESLKNTEKKKNGLTKNSIEIGKQVTTALIQWPENITEIYLINQNLSAESLDTSNLPSNIVTLNLSRNKLGYVPSAVLNIKCLRNLDLSFNNVEYFDETPSFCHTIERLNMEKNNLHGPPYWVWKESPQKLSYINLRHNIEISKSLTGDYTAELMSFKTLVKHLIIDNCRLKIHLLLLSTFVEAKELDIGSREFNYGSRNKVSEFPCQVLKPCLTIERINLSNIDLFEINSNIEIYSNLVEIDLSHNNLSSLPNEFCSLKKLRVCVLSHNSLLYLPDSITELEQLTHLYLDSNELCIVPSLTSLENLELFDLYNNCLSELPKVVENVSELDFAQNYFVEHIDDDYMKKKEKIRAKGLQSEKRLDGNKIYEEPSESEHSSSEFSSDESSWTANSDSEDPNNSPPSSPSDWDSDSHWVPHPAPHSGPPTSHACWLSFVRSKMREGNFCPMDQHLVPVIEKVKYERLCGVEKAVEVVPGQFDDLSGDEES